MPSHLHLGLQSGLFTVRVLDQYPVRATCPANVLDLVTRIMFDEQYRS